MSYTFEPNHFATEQQALAAHPKDAPLDPGSATRWRRPGSGGSRSGGPARPSC